MAKDANAALLIADPDMRSIVTEHEGEFLLTDNLKQEIGNPDFVAKCKQIRKASAKGKTR